MEGLQREANEALESVMLWGSQNKLSFVKISHPSPAYGRSLHPNGPGDQASRGDIDRNLTFKSHVAAQSKKATDICNRLACAKVSWGLNSEIIRTIYTTVIEPIITYGASACYQATELRMIH